MRLRRLTLLSVAATLGLLVVGCTAATPPDRKAAAAPSEFAPAAGLVLAVSDAPLPYTETVDVDWLAATAEATDIPELALRAYASATIRSNAENPDCAASWNTLAGIGWIESQHGGIFDGVIDANGTVSPPIYGVPLDGVGVAEIPDSDGGAIDADATIDRAVGPLQLIPGTWRNWHVDANGDGVEDPHNLYDAALAGVHYLCRAGGDLSTEDGWQAGILAWNRSEIYLQDVAAAAIRYADEAPGA